LEIAVIGSGPSGLACIKTILDVHKGKVKSIALSVYDIAENFDENPQTKLNGATALKDYFGDAFSYDQNRHTKISGQNKPPNLWASSGLGGFSRVWGATLVGATERSFFGNFYEEMDLNSSLLTDAGKRIHSRYEKIDRTGLISLERLPLKMAIKSSACTKCGDCLTGCPNDAIWCSSDELTDIDDYVDVKRETVKFLTILEDGRISLESTSMLRTFDKVFIAAGPLSTATILYNSSLIEGQCYLQDSQTIFSLFLQKRTKPSKEKFALAQASFNLQSKAGLVGNIQIYPCGETLVQKLATNKLLKFMSVRFLNHMSNFLAAGISYLPPESSGRIYLQKGQNGQLLVDAMQPKQRIRILIRYAVIAFKSLRKLGLWQIPIFRTAGIGEGYHFGNLQASDGSDNVELLRKREIYVVGAAALKELPTGPITDYIVQDTVKRVISAFKAC